MPLLYVRNDITKMEVDVIVNSTSKDPSFGRGVDFAIFEEGGNELVQARTKLGSIEVTEAKHTNGYTLPCKFVIHTVGPYWHGYSNESHRELRNTYINCLKLAEELNVTSIAFPLISSGQNGLPKKVALDIATQTIKRYLQSPKTDSDITIYIVLFDKESYNITKEEHHVISFTNTKMVTDQMNREKILLDLERLFFESQRMNMRTRRMSKMNKMESFNYMADIFFEEPEENFKKMLFELIDRSGLTDPEVYKKANITKATFNKIRNKESYNPSKKIILALCCALELDMKDTNSLLRSAGLALSESTYFDIIVKYFIENKEYDIFVINEYLYEYDQTLLGSN